MGGVSGENSSSPPSIPDSKKTPKWVEGNLDGTDRYKSNYIKI
jgi:hypothetical protein